MLSLQIYFSKTRKLTMRKILNSELGRLSVEEYSQKEQLPITVILDNIRSLNNIGSVFRSADAFGIEHICLCGITATPPNREIHKTALGAEITLPWSYHNTTIEAISELRSKGYTIVAVEQVEGATMLNEFKLSPENKYAIVFGNEVNGVEQQAVDMCNCAIEIPQVGTKHSLNVSVSAGVVMWELFSQINRSFK